MIFDYIKIARQGTRQLDIVVTPQSPDDPTYVHVHMYLYPCIDVPSYLIILKMSYGPSYYVVIIIKAINYICRRREEEEKMVTGRCMYHMWKIFKRS